jgi:hypothetical protein
MRALQLDQLAPQRVELPVGDDGRVEHVVAELVVGHLRGQLRVPFAHICLSAHEHRG